jgi:hypothetical protein
MGVGQAVDWRAAVWKAMVVCMEGEGVRSLVASDYQSRNLVSGRARLTYCSGREALSVRR